MDLNENHPVQLNQNQENMPPNNQIFIFRDMKKPQKHKPLHASIVLIVPTTCHSGQGYKYGGFYRANAAHQKHHYL